MPDNSVHCLNTSHRASTSMYSVTFCIRVMSPERHHWKPAVQAAPVMLRTPPLPPVTGGGWLAGDWPSTGEGQ